MRIVPTGAASCGRIGASARQIAQKRAVCNARRRPARCWRNLASMCENQRNELKLVEAAQEVLALRAQMP